MFNDNGKEYFELKHFIQSFRAVLIRTSSVLQQNTCNLKIHKYCMLGNDNICDKNEKIHLLKMLYSAVQCCGLQHIRDRK